jgi:solute carrier family 25 folate transporter 32
MCLQYSQIDGTINQSYKYKNSLDALRHLLKSDGVRGLYKGLLPGYFGTINGTIQMVTYDNMKYWYSKYLRTHYGDSDELLLNSKHYMVFSGLSKCIAVISTYPFQLVRARLQVNCHFPFVFGN